MRKPVVFLLAIIILCAGMFSYSSGAEESISWTEEELLFMEEHPVIRVGVDPEFVPFEFIDSDGEYKGIAADYLAIISEKTGLQFEIEKGLTWPEAFDKAVNGDIDMVPAISMTEERQQYFLFTEPYYHFKRVIVTRDTEADIFGIEDLEGLTVAVQRNSSHHSYLIAHKGINLSLYDSVELALTAVANGTERAYVGNLATSNYLIRSTGLTNLKFIAFEAEKEQAIYMAVRQDWPELISIFNKALDTITQEEKIAINNRWIELVQETTDYGPLLEIIFLIGALGAIVLGVSFFWIQRLRKEVKMREKIQKDLEIAKREADEANEFKSSFMARMSHEIRTPLNAITGMAYLLKKSGLSLTQTMYADRITQASHNMLSIINDILDFSKIEAGKVELEITSFSMDQVLQDVVNIVSYKIEEQKIGFRISKDPQMANWYFGDSKRIEQILLNTLNNAAKFTAQGEVSLDVRLIAKENDWYHLSFTVKDTGIGMTEEQVKNLFQPFTQGDNTITRRFGGSGLGLSIVKNLLDMMGGEVQVFSTPNEGSTFIIHLSLEVDREKEQEYMKNMAANHFKDLRVLVLEKTGSNMNLIEKYLGSYGISCELTSSQNSAVSMLEAADGKFAQGFDLLIVDYETPEEGGFSFVESLRKNPGIRHKPKVMMLIPMMREDLFDQLEQYHVDVGVGKPILPSILFNGILDVFRLRAVSASQPSENPEREGQKSLPLGDYTVLLVEDNKTNQLIASSLLQQEGIKVLVADNGKIGVEMYEDHEHEIDVILMDLHMPVMNGYEAASEIRKQSSEVPIIALTADVILGVKEKCEESGIHHYISKPFQPDRFLRTIADLLEERNSRKREKERTEEKEKVLDQVSSVLNREMGLRNMGGNEELYRRVLREYTEENKDILEMLHSALHEKRYEDGAQIAHKIKSSSGSIGATLLYEAGGSLQKSFQEGREPGISEKMKAFDALFKKFLDEVES